MKRHPFRPTFVRALALSLLSVLLLSAGPALAEEHTTILTGKVRTTVTRNPIIHFNGVVDEVLVTPGDKVVAGQPVMRYTLQAVARRDLQREVNLGAGTESLQAQIETLNSNLAQVEAERNRARSLAATGLGSNKAFGRLEGDVQSIHNRIKLLESSVAKSQENFNLRLDELSDYFNTEIVEGQTLPQYLYLKSPIDGYVLSINDTANPGATFGAGFAPIAIGQMDPMLIQVPVYEAEVSDIKVGDSAVVEIPSLEDKKFKATVTEIAWVSNAMGVAEASYFNVELTIPNPELELKPGFKAVVRFTHK